MNIQSRLNNILDTHERYNTLIEIEHHAEEFAASHIALGDYSSFQQLSAQETAKILQITEPANRIGIDPISEILYLCAATRPSPCKWDNSNETQYQNWKAQHENKALAQSWAEEIKSMGNRKLEALSSHLRTDDISKEVFVTSFKEGTVHQHDSQHGDSLDFEINYAC